MPCRRGGSHEVAIASREILLSAEGQPITDHATSEMLATTPDYPGFRAVSSRSRKHFSTLDLIV